MLLRFTIRRNFAKNTITMSQIIPSNQFANITIQGVNLSIPASFCKVKGWTWHLTSLNDENGNTVFIQLPDNHPLCNEEIAIWNASLDSYFSHKKYRKKDKKMRLHIQAYADYWETLNSLILPTYQEIQIRRNLPTIKEWFDRIAIEHLLLSCRQTTDFKRYEGTPHKNVISKIFSRETQTLREFQNPYNYEDTPALALLTDTAIHLAQKNRHFHNKYYLPWLKALRKRNNTKVQTVTFWFLESDRQTVSVRQRQKGKPRKISKSLPSEVNTSKL